MAHRAKHQPAPKARTAAGSGGVRVAALRRSLLAWFDRHQRPLPWRVTPPNPYHVWLSEVMLQQTQVATMLPYWRRFIGRFPTVESLAQADIDDVLAHWAGLGYYRRAHHLHAAARRIMAQHAARIPDDAATLRTLPGVGRYTAGAVASIAFGRREPVLDGNVARVLSRVFHRPGAGAGGANGGAATAGRRNGDARARTHALWRLAESLLPATRPGDFNQALMELGALVCLPQSPRCQACPVARHCGARAHGAQQTALPSTKHPARKPIEVASLVVRRRERVLLERRPDGGLWSGMWELPSATMADGKDAARTAESVLQRLGLGATTLSTIGMLTRVLTHRTYRVHVFTAAKPRGRIARSSRFRWCDPRRPGVGVIGPSAEALRLAGLQAD